MHIWESVIDFTSTLMAIVAATATFQFSEVQVLIAEPTPSVEPQIEHVEPETVYPLTRDDAIKIAIARGYHPGSQGYFKLDKVYFDVASSTGSGNAWFIEDQSFKTAADDCPTMTNARQIKIEINADTGVVDVQKNCFKVIFD